MNIDEIRKRHQKRSPHDLRWVATDGFAAYRDRALLLAEVERLQAEMKKQDTTIEQLQGSLEEWKLDCQANIKRAETAESNLARLLEELRVFESDLTYREAGGYIKHTLQRMILDYRPTADCNVSDRLIETNNES